ncbi:hypothetical protein Bind_3867 (plasmid) [Beijerinckia indica subsp. indica ATCC 9039]|uniref:Uncharacterized protein n=1 Tax=Beijerinckia indica subsp. indica (strain ATCC 9039 / DSM 1715 / NCIMB 8712) TaxID=395963 RepID=B2ILJ6_BEII9|nr:hypothetical protein Bind_3867 [Beijerinckia indica subsp. indica ATCC 9039]
MNGLYIGALFFLGLTAYSLFKGFVRGPKRYYILAGSIFLFVSSFYVAVDLLHL